MKRYFSLILLLAIPALSFSETLRTIKGVGTYTYDKTDCCDNRCGYSLNIQYIDWRRSKDGELTVAVSTVCKGKKGVAERRITRESWEKKEHDTMLFYCGDTDTEPVFVLKENRVYVAGDDSDSNVVQGPDRSKAESSRIEEKIIGSWKYELSLTIESRTINVSRILHFADNPIKCSIKQVQDLPGDCDGFTTTCDNIVPIIQADLIRLNKVDLKPTKQEIQRCSPDYDFNRHNAGELGSEANIYLMYDSKKDILKDDDGAIYHRIKQ